MTTNQNGNTPAPKKKKGHGFIFLLIIAVILYMAYRDGQKNAQPSQTEQNQTGSRTENSTNTTRPPESKGPITTYSTVPISSLWYTYSPSLHWYYEQLSTAEKRAYSARYDAIALGDVSLWDISGLGLNDYQIKRVELAFGNDCPELMVCSVIEKTTDFYSALEDQNWFQENAKSVQTDLSSCLRELDRLESVSSWGHTDLQKEQTFDREIARKTDYLLDNDGPEGTLHIDSNVRSPLSAIVNRTAVCEGFARSVQLAMRYFGIPCLYISGTVNSSGNRHAWNLVQIDGSWYHYDATWNSNGRYINLSDSAILSERSVDAEFSNYGFIFPSCW